MKKEGQINNTSIKTFIKIICLPRDWNPGINHIRAHSLPSHHRGLQILKLRIRTGVCFDFDKIIVVVRTYSDTVWVHSINEIKRYYAKFVAGSKSIVYI